MKCDPCDDEDQENCCLRKHKTASEIAMSLSPTRAEALAQKIERSQFGIALSSEEIAMIVMALRRAA